MFTKPIQFGSHALFEMRRRGITRAEVERTVRSPGQVLSSDRGRQIFQSLTGRAGRLLLRVIVAEDEQGYHVVTTYKTSKVAKYWSTT